MDRMALNSLSNLFVTVTLISHFHIATAKEL